MIRRTFLTRIGLGLLASASPVVITAVIAQSKDQHVDKLQSRISETVVFYVATDGKDSWSGKLSEPNTERSDGPFATIMRSRDAIRELKRQQGGQLKQSVTVCIKEGTYFLTKPLVFTAIDSGTKRFPITYASYQDQKPVISGGQRITEWQQELVNGKTLWTAKIPEVQRGEWYFRQLWINGQRRTRARYPSKGYLQVANVPDVSPKTVWHQGQKQFEYAAGDLQSWETVTEGEVIVMTRWVESRLPIASVNETEKIISFDETSVLRIDPGNLYYVEGVFETLDTPGEWYLDRTQGKLYYYPMDDESIDNIEAIAPAIGPIIQLLAQVESGRHIQHLKFQGLTFAHTKWSLPSGHSGFAMGAFLVPGAIHGVGAAYCIFKECTFAHLGTYAIDLKRGCHHNSIVDCNLFDLAGGIKFGEAEIRKNEALHTHTNEVANCHIYDGGRIFHSGMAIWVGQSYNNRVAHNHIHDFYNTTIHLGRTWGYGQTLAKGNIIEFNYVHHIGDRSDGDGPILNDLGAVHTLGVQPGTEIRSNLIHNVDAFSYGGWGIYLDSTSSRMVVKNNLVYRTRDGALHHNNGKHNTICNNIFAFGRLAQIRRSGQSSRLSFTFENNIVYWSDGKLLDGKWSNFGFAFDRNIYWKINNDEIYFSDLTWEKWQANGMDRNSIVADPLFVSPEEGDFELKPGSPAFQVGFQSISEVYSLKSA